MPRGQFAQFLNPKDQTSDDAQGYSLPDRRHRVENSTQGRPKYDGHLQEISGGESAEKP